MKINKKSNCSQCLWSHILINLFDEELVSSVSGRGLISSMMKAETNLSVTVLFSLTQRCLLLPSQKQAS